MEPPAEKKAKPTNFNVSGLPPRDVWREIFKKWKTQHLSYKTVFNQQHFKQVALDTCTKFRINTVSTILSCLELLNVSQSYLNKVQLLPPPSVKNKTLSKVLGIDEYIVFF